MVICLEEGVRTSFDQEEKNRADKRQVSGLIVSSHKEYFVSFFTIGFILAISLQSGYDISQEGIAILILHTLQSVYPVEDLFFSLYIDIMFFY